MSTITSPRISGIMFIGTGAVVFFANASLLILQLVAGKLLAPFIGSSIETWTSVIGVFLTGIALGNWLGGRLADRFPSPRTVSVLLILGGLSSFGMVLCYELALHTGFYKAFPLEARIPLLALLFCLFPALLFSLLTPLTIKLILADVGSAGRIAGLVFALSTLGCLIGNYFTGFWLMAYFTLNEMALGVGIGLIALAIPIFFIKKTSAATGSPPPEPDSTEPVDDNIFTNNIRLSYAVVFIASFCGMSLELAGSRLLAPYLGVSLYTWTGIIGVMLAGTASGNYLGGVLADRGVGPAVHRFAILLGLLAGAAVGPFVVREWTVGWNAEFTTHTPTINDYLARCMAAAIGVLDVLAFIRLSKSRLAGRLLSALIGGVFGMVLLHALGDVYPKVVARVFGSLNIENSATMGVNALGFVLGAVTARLFAWDAPQSGERTSRVGALSGSVFLGGVMTLGVLLSISVFSNYPSMTEQSDLVLKVLAWTFGMFFLPMLLLGTISPQAIRLSVPEMRSAGRIAGSIYAWSTVGAIAGTFTTGYFLISSLGTMRVVLILALVLTLAAFCIGQLWKNNVMLYAASVICGGAIFGLYLIDFGAKRFTMETKYYAILVRGDDNFRSLTLDHLVHSIVNVNDPSYLHYHHEYVQVELAALARRRGPEPNVLVIGGGFYTFPHYLEVFAPDVHVDVVEIDPGVTEIAHREGGLPRDTRIKSYHMDGRQFVSEQALKHHYQLVVQDAVNDLSVPGHLLTREYNDAVKETLAPDGVYLLSLIDSLSDGKLWRAAVSTMRQSFKYVRVLAPARQNHFDWDRRVYVIYGSDQPFDLEAVHAAAGLTQGTPESPWPWTTVFPDEQIDAALKQITKADESKVAVKEMILTDQYCPVDNLMSEVFREQAREHH